MTAIRRHRWFSCMQIRGLPNSLISATIVTWLKIARNPTLWFHLLCVAKQMRESLQMPLRYSIELVSTWLHVQPLQGCCGGFSCRLGVRCATTGYVVGLLRSYLNDVHQPERRPPTPTGFNITAQGRAAHPGITAPVTREPQRGSTWSHPKGTQHSPKGTQRGHSICSGG